MRFPLALAALAFFASPAAAESIVVQCEHTSPWLGAVICDTQGAVPLASDGPGATYMIRLTAPTTHCSDVSYMVFREEERRFALGMTPRLAPGQSADLVLGNDFVRGEQKIYISAVGYISG